MSRALKLCIVCGLVIYGLQSCDDPLGIKDCSTVGLLLDITKEIDSTNALTVDFGILYGGTHTLDDNVEWDFGDGTMQTISGREAQHTYSSTGTYTVKAQVVLSGSDIGTCPKEITQQVIL